MLQGAANHHEIRVEGETSTFIPELQPISTGSNALVPVILDEIVHLFQANGLVLVQYDAAHREIQVDQAAGSWQAYKGAHFRLHINITGLVSSTGQWNVSLEKLLKMKNDAFSIDDPRQGFLAYTPLFINGCHQGSLWIDRQYLFSRDELSMFASMADAVSSAIYCLSASTEKNLAPIEAIQVLVKLLYTWDDPTYQHSIRTVSWSRSTARKLGLDEADVEAIGWAALLHDIGKIGVPKSILHKPGPLNDQEWEIIKLHSKFGARLVEHIQPLYAIKEIIAAHHEKMDGSGYPFGLSGEDIPLGARIIAVIDAYTTMTDDLVYRPALTHEQAIHEILQCSGSQFDPQVIEVFVQQFR